MYCGICCFGEREDFDGEPVVVGEWGREGEGIVGDCFPFGDLIE